MRLAKEPDEFVKLLQVMTKLLLFQAFVNYYCREILYICLIHPENKCILRYGRCSFYFFLELAYLFLPAS